MKAVQLPAEYAGSGPVNSHSWGSMCPSLGGGFNGNRTDTGPAPRSAHSGDGLAGPHSGREKVKTLRKVQMGA